MQGIHILRVETYPRGEMQQLFYFIVTKINLMGLKLLKEFQ